VGLCNREAITYLVYEFAIVLVCDVGSLSVGCYWRSLILRLYLLINELNIVSGPMSRKSLKSFFSVDQVLPRASPLGLGKRCTYWRPIEPDPKRFASEKIW
jgi:hypothetical protein